LRNGKNLFQKRQPVNVKNPTTPQEKKKGEKKSKKKKKKTPKGKKEGNFEGREGGGECGGAKILSQGEGKAACPS